MNRRLPDAKYWAGKRVLITGHTGFKGGWLAILLTELGASVTGISDRIPTVPSFYAEAEVDSILEEDKRIDVRDGKALEMAVQSLEPEVVFHLAAQPLVIDGIRNPVETFSTNVMGTVNVLESCARTPSVRICIIVTTDKVYRPIGMVHSYEEGDPLGGYEPYSASKVGAEMAAASYMTLVEGTGLQIATCRAGNVIGGGDWSAWRLVPDLLRAFDSGGEIQLRQPEAVRPWQHVLDPLVGYVLLAERLGAEGGAQLPRSWNFGPRSSGSRSVLDVIRAVEDVLGSRFNLTVLDEPYDEAAFLALSSLRAERDLGWTPALDFLSSVEQTVRWHLAWRSGGEMGPISRAFVREYFTAPLAS